MSLPSPPLHPLWAFISKNIKKLAKNNDFSLVKVFMMGDKTKIFIEKAKVVHGDKYDYSKVKYNKAIDKVCIICPIHGEFWQTPQVHLRGGGCYQCGLEKIRTKNTTSKEEFIERAKKVHGDKYDYSKVEYVNNCTKVCIICPIHGEFWQTPQVHLRGGGCIKCYNESKSKTSEEFIAEAVKIHGNKYDYSKVEYINAHTKVRIICKEHGEFLQTPCNHLNGNGCPKCKGKILSETRRKPLDDFINEANIIHNNKYFYNEAKYITCDDKITIICPIHQQSLAEDEICKHIEDKIGKGKIIRRINNIFGNKLEIDILIPSLNIGIEYNGLYWHSEEYGKDRFYHVMKTDMAQEKGIKLIQIFEDEWTENKELVLNKIDHILGISNSLPKIFARKTSVKEITLKEAKEFFAKNHIQGFVPSTLYIGAFYDDMLIGAISFKQEKENEWNLTRMATDINYICIGVCGKMFSFFTKKYTWKKIKTFADRRWTNSKEDNIYIKLGFKLKEVLKPDYRYIVNKKRVHKFNFRKKILSEKFKLKKDLTEKEMANILNLKKIWDCGLFKYEMVQR